MYLIIDCSYVTVEIWVNRTFLLRGMRGIMT